MARYYVNQNAQANGDHEVHQEGCSWMPAEHNRTFLGHYDSCYGAVLSAQAYYSQVNGCYYCSNNCHTS